MINEMKQRLPGIQTTADLFDFLHPNIYYNVDDNELGLTDNVVIETFTSEMSTILASDLKNFRRL